MAGYSYRATVEGTQHPGTYELDVAVGKPVNTTFRSYALDPDAWQAFHDLNGSAQDPGGAAGLLGEARVAQDDGSAVPLVHEMRFFDEQGQRDPARDVRLTAYVPDWEMPEGYWSFAAVHFEDGQGNSGTWEYAPQAERQRGEALVPYMEGQSLEDLAAFEVLLVLYGLELYMAYPNDLPLPDGDAVVDAAGRLLEPEPEDPDPEDPEEEEGFNVTRLAEDVLGSVPGLPPVPGLSVEHHEDAEDGHQRFRIVFGVGVPIPREIDVEVFHEATGSARIHVDLEQVLGAPDVPGLPDVDDGLPVEPPGGLPDPVPALP